MSVHIPQKILIKQQQNP